MSDEKKDEAKKEEVKPSPSSNAEQPAKGADGAKTPETPPPKPESKAEVERNGTSSNEKEKLVVEALEREKKLKERLDRLETELQTIKAQRRKMSIFKAGVLKQR